MHRWSFVSLIIFTYTGELCVGAGLVNRSEHTETVLVDYLLSKYPRTTVRPVLNHEKSVNVTLRLILSQVIELNERIQKMVISSWFRLSWTDEHLRWNPTDFKNVTSIVIRVDDVWHPDVTLYNNIDEEFQRIKYLLDLIVYHDGTVSYSSPTIFHTFCKINVRFFPLDVQHCRLEFGTWVYHMGQENLYPDVSSQSTQTEYHENGVWNLVGVFTEREERKYNCCPETYAMVKYNVVLRRRERFFVEIILLPCCLLSFLTMFVFLLPPESGEKTSFGVTTLLAILLFQQLIAQTLPPSADSTPIIQSYFTTLMCMSCFSVVATAFVMNIYNRGQTHRAPLWLRSLLLGRLGRTIGRNHQKTSYFKGVLTHGGNMRGDGGFYVMNQTSPHDYEMTEKGTADQDNEKKRRSNVKLTQNGSKELPRIYEELRKMNKERETSKMKEKIVNEWREVAVVVDRILLFLTLLIALTASITVIVLITTHQHNAVTNNYF